MTTQTEAPPSLAASLMQQLYGQDIYAGFKPPFSLDLQGWNSEHDIFPTLFEALRPRVILDVGVWKGRSACFLAHQLARLKIDGVVVAIDTFQGSPEHWNRDRPDRAFDSLRLRHGYPGLYWQFLSNVVLTGMHSRILPLAQTSENAALILRRLKLKAELIHIDAAHEYEPVLRDARLYWSLLAPGGALVGDDFEWEGVARAAREFAAEVGQALEVQNPKWILRKPA